MKKVARSVDPDLGKLSLPDLGTVMKLRTDAIENHLSKQSGPTIRFAPSLIAAFDIEVLGQMARTVCELKDTMAQLAPGLTITISGRNHYDCDGDRSVTVTFTITGTGSSGQQVQGFEKNFVQSNTSSKFYQQLKESLQSIINIAQFL